MLLSFHNTCLTNQASGDIFVSPREQRAAGVANAAGLLCTVAYALLFGHPEHRRGIATIVHDCGCPSTMLGVTWGRAAITAV